MKGHLWVTAVLMLLAAGLLVADVGTPAIWIAAISVGIAVVAIDRRLARRTG
jgi:hypothetical protein